MVPHPLWRILLAVGVVTIISLYFLLVSAYSTSHLNRNDAQSAKHEEVRKSLPEFYPWTTVSDFPVLGKDALTNATISDLCQYFPKDKLLDVQPVLKTGHGVMKRVRDSLRSTSACLDNLMIFSDLEEDVDGHAVIDVIADIPDKLLKSTRQTRPYRKLIKAQQANSKLKEHSFSSKQGWKIDKFKFLTSISRAWRMAPDKRWYVFYEGDSHIVWDTVFRLLANFDADVPLYFGSPSPGREGTWFANGGPGYIISRGAMRKLVATDWDLDTGEWLGSKLAERYWDLLVSDCCGDSVLGWALHEHGVDLSGLWPTFNPHSLAGIPFSDLYWCQPVLSLHKSSPQDVEELWRWQWKHHKPFRPLLYRDLAREFFDFTIERRDDWDNGEWDAYEPAPDDPWKPNDSADACHTACVGAEACFQWTYHLRKCWFVRSIRLGRSREPHLEDGHKPEDWTQSDQRYLSGWDTAKIRDFIEEEQCDEVQWVRPSTSRIF